MSLLNDISEALSDFESGGVVRLTHFSHVDGLTEIDPEKMFSGADRSNRDVRSKTSLTRKRSYWGVGVGEHGGYDPAKDTKTLAKAKHVYVADYPIDKIYDWSKDTHEIGNKLRLKIEQLKSEHPNGIVDSATIYKHMDDFIAEEGFDGVAINNPTYGKAVYLWVKVKVKQVQ